MYLLFVCVLSITSIASLGWANRVTWWTCLMDLVWTSVGAAGFDVFALPLWCESLIVIVHHQFIDGRKIKTGPEQAPSSRVTAFFQFSFFLNTRFSTSILLIFTSLKGLCISATLLPSWVFIPPLQLCLLPLPYLLYLLSLLFIQWFVITSKRLLCSCAMPE